MSIYLRGGAGGVGIPERSTGTPPAGCRRATYEYLPAGRRGRGGDAGEERMCILPGETSGAGIGYARAEPDTTKPVHGEPRGRAAPVRVPGDDRIYLAEEKRQFR